MGLKYKFSELLGDKVIYEINDISEFTQSFVDGIDFKGRKKSVVFCKNGIKNEWFLANQKFSGKSISIIYSIHKSDLKLEKKNNLKFRTGILRQADFLDFYYDTKKNFYDKFKNQLSNRFWREYSFVVSKLLLKGKHLCVFNTHGEKSAIISMIIWKDVFNRKVNWINWVWISGDIKRKDKKIVRYIFKDWIKKNATYSKIECLVNLFNIPSQKFFNKLGFIPKCLNISKLSD